MGINQDAFDLWNEDLPSGDRLNFLETLNDINKAWKLPRPTKADLTYSGIDVLPYDELNPKTKLAIKEFIFGASNDDYRHEFNELLGYDFFPS